jgi:hypothetical protein
LRKFFPHLRLKEGIEQVVKKIPYFGLLNYLQSYSPTHVYFLYYKLKSLCLIIIA